MVSAHFMTLMEYETDASEIRSYEADLIPGLLQTGEYALAIAEIYFPLKGVAQHLQLVEFRMARQKALQDRRARLSDGAEIKLTFIVNEVALRRRVGDSAVYRRQLEKLIDDVASDQQEIRVVRSTVTLPATLGGPFVLFSFPADSPEADLVYIESRTGGDYLTAPADVERYNGYFASLLEVALGGDEVVALLRSIIAGIGDPG